MIKVLIVDDENSIRVTLSKFLINENFETDIAENAEAAYHLMEEKEFDIIITDIIMPCISGIDMLTKIREKSKSVYVIIMTGEPTVETAVKAVKSGANDYIIKPINKGNLMNAVHHGVKMIALLDEKNIIEEQNKMYRKSLEDIVNVRTCALKLAMKSIVFLLSSIVGARDPYTASHQIRVGNLAASIAQKMGMQFKTINLLRLIGYIHDIGKIVIPTEILSKSGKLSDLEMQMIKDHPESGYKMLNNVDLPDIIAKTEYQHHERCDGSGYPNGLEYDEILDETHIIIISDVVEAMMSHRPYRPALGIKAALCEIKKNAGVLYKQEVVDACVNLFISDDYEIDDIEHEIHFPL